MAFDSIGQPLKAGDILAIPVWDKQMTATVKEIKSGIGSNLTPGPDGQLPAAQPMVVVNLELNYPVYPNQRIMDAIKIGEPAPALSEK